MRFGPILLSSLCGRWVSGGCLSGAVTPELLVDRLRRCDLHFRGGSRSVEDELTGPRGEGYRRMIEASVAGRAGTPDEVGTVAALLMGPDGGFITGSDILMDGGVTAAYWYGELAPVQK